MDKTKTSIRPTYGGSVFGAAILVVVLMYPTPVFAEEKAADVDRFCRQFFGAEAVAGVDRRDNGLLCTIRKSGGLEMIHQKITPDTVCGDQHGTKRFRRESGKLYCITGEARTAKRTIDLEKHCRDAYGPDAFVTKRTTDNSPMCTLRTSGGLGLQHHVIDTSSICGGGSARVDDKTLHCGGTSSNHTSDDPDNGEKLTPDDIQAARNREFPPLEPEDIIDTGGTGDLTDKNVKFANLKDCGGILDDPQRMFRDPDGLDGLGPEYQGVSKLCLGLTGGKTIDFLTYCNSVASRETVRSIKFTPSGRPICWRRGRAPLDAISQLALMDTAAASGHICLHALALYERFGVQYRNYVVLYKYRVRKTSIECFYMKRAQLAQILKGAEPTFEIYFTEPEPPYARIEELVVGQLYRIVIEFNEPPDQENAPLTLTNSRSGATVSAIAFPSNDSKIFRTSPLQVLPEVEQ